MHPNRQSASALVRRFARISLFAIVQLALVLILSEVALRWIRPHSRSLRTVLYDSTSPSRFEDIESLPELLEQSIRGYQPFEVSHGFVLNSRGLRTKEYSTKKEPGTYRVLAIGDSFTNASGGIPHPRHWPTLLEEGLAKRRNGRVEVLRLGVGGTGPQFQLRLWQIEGALLEADAVVLGFFVGDDFLTGPQRLVRTFPRDPSDRLASASLTYRLIRNLRRVRGGAEEQAAEKSISAPSALQKGGYEIVEYRDRFDPAVPKLTPQAHLRIEARRMAFTRLDRKAWFEALFEGVTETLDAFHAEVTRAGAEFVVLIIPDEYQVHSELRDAVLKETRSMLEDYDLERPQRLLVEFLSERGIAYVDLLPHFREAAEKARLYLPHNTHWNFAGNRLAARLLLEYFASVRSNPPPMG